MSRFPMKRTSPICYNQSGEDAQTRSRSRCYRDLGRSHDLPGNRGQTDEDLWDGGLCMARSRCTCAVYLDLSQMKCTTVKNPRITSVDAGDIKRTRDERVSCPNTEKRNSRINATIISVPRTFSSDRLPDTSRKL
jgi:hypothetical protein